MSRATTSSTSGDSAGQPWAGRTLPAGGFSDDDGSADAGLRDALQRTASGHTGAVDVIAALAAARVMVAVVAVLGEGGDEVSVHGDKQADMALVTITGADGRRALPVFSSPVTLAAWNPSARPVPVSTRRAARAALAEGCERLVLDAAGPTPFLASRSALVALGEGRAWEPAHTDHHVGERLSVLVAGEPDVVGVDRRPGTAAELRVELSVRPGLTSEQLSRLVARVGERLTSDEVLRERADGLELVVVAA